MLYNWIIVIYLMSLIPLCLTGHIVFGHGLGDLIYLLITLFSVMIQLTLTGICYSKKRQKGWENSFIICGTIFLIISLLLTYKFTVGRGPEWRWNGEVFI